jgi:hypothetical protein
MSETDAMVFVVDDDAPMRESLKNLIRSIRLRVELYAFEFLGTKIPLPTCSARARRAFAVLCPSSSAKRSFVLGLK